VFIRINIYLSFSNLGWGKRRDLINEDDDDDYLFYRPFASHEYSARSWFDDK
jgi:hypothetical protein